MTSPLGTSTRMVRGAALAAVLAAIVASPQVSSGQAARRPMTFLDMQHLRTLGNATPSPDGRWMLYTLSEMDWKEGKRQTDLHLVSLETGVASARQMTFTREKDESSPAWARDSSFFAFLSNREAPESAANRNQIYVMRPDGGEARRITDAKEGVAEFAFSSDGRLLVFRSGKPGEEQLYRLPVSELGSAPDQITKHPTGIGRWQPAPDGRRIYFVTPDAADPDDRARREKKFTVAVRNAETPPASLWALDLDPLKTSRLTPEGAYSVDDVTVARDGRWIAFRGLSTDRYKRNITQQNLYGDLYLLEVGSGRIERLTSNSEVAESGAAFSPDSRLIAFSAPDDLERYSMTNARVYVRAVADRGKAFRKLGGSFDGDVTIGFWARDGRTIYFNEGIRATNQLFALDVEGDRVRQITRELASLSAEQDDDSGVVIIQYADGTTPATYFTLASVEGAADRSTWRRLTDANPQVAQFELGAQEEITWRSTDGTTVGGVVVKPVGYQAGKRYPLIVAIHGGPASADVLGFNGGYGSQVYAGAGYVVLRPNYRGSTNYGQKHKTDIVGNYFQPGYEDIMAGVDHLIAEGLVDPQQMGVLGWSAGGHWSNWILTHTDRFKAISSGAGTSNWISMYAQSDVQRNRQYYLGDKLPYDDFEAYWNQSPLKYIRNAKTPTMIHVVEGDPRVPSPQSVELHMALKQIGVPTELFIYPGNTHGIPDGRNQLVKAMSEMAWMDYYVRGRGKKFSWRDVLKTLEESTTDGK